MVQATSSRTSRPAPMRTRALATARRPSRALLRGPLNVGPVLILVLLIAGISLLTPNFLKPGTSATFSPRRL